MTTEAVKTEAKRPRKRTPSNTPAAFLVDAATLDAFARRTVGDKPAGRMLARAEKGDPEAHALVALHLADLDACDQVDAERAAALPDRVGVDVNLAVLPELARAAGAERLRVALVRLVGDLFPSADQVRVALRQPWDGPACVVDVDDGPALPDEGMRVTALVRDQAARIAAAVGEELADEPAPDLATVGECARCDTRTAGLVDGLCALCRAEVMRLDPAPAPVAGDPEAEQADVDAADAERAALARDQADEVGPATDWPADLPHPTTQGAPAPYTGTRTARAFPDEWPRQAVEYAHGPGPLAPAVSRVVAEANPLAQLAPLGLLPRPLVQAPVVLGHELVPYVWRAREAWLLRAADALTPLLVDVVSDVARALRLPLPEQLVPPFRVGLTNERVENPKSGLLGMAYHPSVSAGAVHEVFIGATLDGGDPVRVLTVLLHELLHVWCVHYNLPCGAGGHQGPFRVLHARLGLEGGTSASLPGEAFRWFVGPLVQQLGNMPHDAMRAAKACTSAKEKQTGRNVSFVCLHPRADGQMVHPSGAVDGEGKPVLVCGFKGQSTATWLRPSEGKFLCPLCAVPFVVKWPEPPAE